MFFVTFPMAIGWENRVAFDTTVGPDELLVTLL
jgi:hypothetical protein